MSDPQIFKVPDLQDPKAFNYVRFEWMAEKNQTATDEAGTPVFDQVLVAFISSPGMKNSEATEPCERKTLDGKVIPNKGAYAKYGKFIEAFKAGDAPPDMVGTPLTELPGIDSAVRATLKAMNCHTVEGLADLSDTVQMMGFHKYKTMARGYLDQAAGQKPLLKISAKLEAAEQENEILKGQIAELASRLSKLEGVEEDAPRPAKKKAA